MKHIDSTLLLTSLILLISVNFWAQYENQRYLPLNKRELANRFPIHYVGTLGDRRPGYFGAMVDQDLPKTIKAGASGISVSVNDNSELMLAGKDRHDKNWNADLGTSPISYACRFYVADLDRNGIRDIALVFPTGGNGLAPSSHFLA